MSRHTSLAALAIAAMLPALSAAQSLGPNLIVNNGFENNPPNICGNNYSGTGNPRSVAPWVVGAGGEPNVVTIDGGNLCTGYVGGPLIDAEDGHAANVQQHFLDILGQNTVSQTFTVPTCGATDTVPRNVDFYGFFSVRDFSWATGSGYIRILDRSVLDVNGNPTELKRVDVNIGSTDANGNPIDPRYQTWKKFADSTAVVPGHQITYEVLITDYLNFDNAFMAFTDSPCASTTLALAKQWNGAANGHAAALTATRDNGATQVDTFTSTATGAPGQVNQDASPFTVFAADEIRISETLSNLGTATYSQSLSCTGDTTVTPLGVGQYSVKIGSVSVNTAPIVCTMVNTNTTQSTLTLVKQWNGAQEGDAAALTATPQGSGAPVTLTSTATSLANDAGGQSQSGTATVVAPGAVYTLTETITGNAVYDKALTCTGAQVGGGGVVTVNSAIGTQAVCTMSNTLAALAITKQQDAVTDTNGSTLVGDAGDVITYSFTVTNTGKATLHAVDISDALPVISMSITWPDPAAPGVLKGGEVATATASYTVTPQDVTDTKVDNTATVSGTTPDNQSVNATSNTVSTPTLAPHPSLSITKTATVADTNQSHATGDAGDVISYQIVVTNTGDVPLSGVKIDDPLAGLTTPVVTWPDNNQPGVLAKGASANAEARYTIAASDAVTGQVSNTATASANPVAGVSAANVSSTAVTPVVKSPVTASATPVPTLGEWALICLSSLMAMAAAVGLRRRNAL
ncbi:IPTL-CTERM sorting domain-containing protein [Diaphorobacter caeni]|uniref:IPTL-CTERM sorting domain-containing protein n=1 Tax=Diaphorobacter caeni TaxID=2784387 RepID=UPI00188E694C|nr:IPTL-CTERM sorting domain-containing protein [Diaphorobacter caeni]MBF5003145.1 IPTL-CTERM sorting domain-containing protein [Diaphorobacter caeni]